MGLKLRGHSGLIVDGRTTEQASDSESGGRCVGRAEPGDNSSRGPSAKLWLAGDRSYPERLVKLPEHLVGGLPDVIPSSQRLNPGVVLADSVSTCSLGEGEAWD